MKDYQADSELLKAMAHPARLKILAGLMENECYVSEMQHNLGIPQSTVSQHLSVLRRQKIIEARRDKVRTCYRIIDARVERLMKMIGK